jgi:hypothetical protein
MNDGANVSRRRSSSAARENDLVIRLFLQMVRVPTSVFVYGLELLLKSVQGMQKAAGQMFQGVDGDPSATGATDNQEMTTMMDDQDLSGDDLKVVRYRILFTKPNLEVTLQRDKEELINYSTNGASFGGLKIAEFLSNHKEKKIKIPRPERWRHDFYPEDYKPAPGDLKQTDWNFPEEDRRYIEFHYEVVDRQERKYADYDQEKVKQLKRIANKP